MNKLAFDELRMIKEGIAFDEEYYASILVKAPF